MAKDTGNKTHIKLHFFEKKDMSKQGYKNFPPKSRHKIIKKVHKHAIYFPAVDVTMINNITNLSEFACNNLYEGLFRMVGYTRRKTRTKVGFTKTLARIEVKLGPDDTFKARVFDYQRLSHYWYWNPL